MAFIPLPTTVLDHPSQARMLADVHNFGVTFLARTGTHLDLIIAHCMLRECFAMMVYSSPERLTAAIQSAESGASLVQLEFPPYDLSPFQTDPLHACRLPEWQPHKYLLALRLHIRSDSSECLHVLLMVPVSYKPAAGTEKLPSMFAADALIQGDVGCSRYQEGVCSNCSKAGKLLVCKGCRAHAYCSTQCSRAMWRQHKALCKYMQARYAESAQST